MNQAVQMEKVKKKYGKKTVLDHIQLSVQEGAIHGLIGPSGAGKTTIVKLVAGMETPERGFVNVFNERMPNLQVLQKIGFMAQSDALYENLTGLEHLRFFGSLFKLKKGEMNDRIDYVANLVNLTEDLSKKVSAYSGGMKRRLSLAIALVHNPNLLILDEPTVGIDPELKLQIWDELFRLKEEGRTIIITTHVMDEAEKCDSITMVRNGKLIAQGTPKELKQVYRTENFDRVFLLAGRDEK
ncbi:ABC transporter ATP-binding protein [Fervidibacillus halotolerans]|uniref:ABC transporter ATP-binding protein n=1 Tax=Fervidibacillus halotolerans TaxID=2980027 RepID=A0A9E8RZG4_9BACI|nr:ABC transporter ATP-binding protein [Fervidibacillus halotolerans]WAA13124.1 ABC transporter ATP-binding protein [Fervidibacillus halotolerans]